jgi:hypothetical protein
MSKAKVQVNGCYNVKSNRILWRTVINDARATDWQAIENGEDFPQTIDGLKQWMHAENLDIQNEWERWQTELLEIGIAGTRNPRVWDYGQQTQFWVPLPMDMRKAEPEIKLPSRLVCINAEGRDELTAGREYNVISTKNNLVMIVNDLGVQEQYFLDRFKVEFPKENRNHGKEARTTTSSRRDCRAGSCHDR